MINYASLFTGGAGFDIAAAFMKWNNVFQCEIDGFCQKMLQFYFKNTKQYEDIRKTDFSIYRGQIDVLTGGFPCQPFSNAGKRKGTEDERYLWEEMLRAIREIQSSYIVAENVYGLINWENGLAFEQICTSMENEGYEVQPYILPALSVDAPHNRKRLWIVAYSNHNGNMRRACKSESKSEEKQIQDRNNIQFAAKSDSLWEITTNSSSIRQQRSGEKGNINKEEKICRGKRSEEISTTLCPKFQKYPTEPPICCGNDGLPKELDGITFSNWRKESIKLYGNAVVPQLALQIFKAIDTHLKQ